MTAHPRPDRDQYEAALRRIHVRRRRAGDDHPLALSDDPREVLAYLRQRGRHGLIADDTGDDVTDALTLRLWLWWEGEAIEVWLLEAAERLGRSRKAVGAVLGLDGSQSVANRLARKRAMLNPTEVQAPQPDASDHDGQVRALVAALVALRGAMPAHIADDLHVGVLAEALPRWEPGAPPPSAGALNALRFLLGDLEHADGVGAELAELMERGAKLVGTRVASSAD